MALTKLNARSATALDATVLTGNLPAISGASLTGVGETNTPCFSARMSAHQSVGDNTTEKLLLIQLIIKLLEHTILQIIDGLRVSLGIINFKFKLLQTHKQQQTYTQS